MIFTNKIIRSTVTLYVGNIGIDSIIIGVATEVFAYLRRGIEWLHPVWKVLAKFGFCSNCSQKLDECSLAHTCKFFASARMLGFSLKFAAVQRKGSLHLKNKNWPWKQCFPCGKLKNIGGTCVRHECSVLKKCFLVF